MENRKLSNYIKLGFGILIAILGIVSFWLLPDKVGMQISASGQLQNYMPKALAVVLPIGVYALGFLPNKNGKTDQWKRQLIISVLAIFIQVFALISNL